jgi:hypothetical protein
VHLPGLPSLLFLALLLLLMPWGAWRTAQRLRGKTGPPVDRVVYWRSAVLSQLILFVLAWLAGAGFGYRIFAVERPIRPTDVLLSLAAFGLCYGLRLVSRSLRSERERRELSVYKRAPRTRVELAWFSLAAVSAGMTEEAAYRGVGWAILSYALGNPWISAFILCLAFSVAHWNQGWKSGVTIFGLAAVHHALVALTGTLVLAMVVHAIYDLVAGYQIRRTARRYDQEAETEAV